MLTHLLAITTGDVMPVIVKSYEFMLNNLSIKSFSSKEMAYFFAFNNNCSSIEHISTTFVS